MPLLGVDALTQHTQVIARCLSWMNNTCPFSTLEPVEFNGLNLTQQTVCKADLSVAVMQIDWESPAGGRGAVESMLVNGVEMLQAPVHPSRAYLVANYPHCNDMFNIFSPWGNGNIGPDGRKSIISEITSDELPISIQFEWKGPHEVHPVCSMVGVSIAGYAEINIYLEAQDNSDCPGWSSASLTACSGNGKCGCAANDYTPRACSCVDGYAAPDCQDCASGFFGDFCKQNCEPCLNDGRCDSGLTGTGKCNCLEGFDPNTRCATCLPGYFGDRCKRCPDCNFPHGNCDDGVMGSGRCSCAVGFDADNNCMECMSSFFGPTCQPCDPCDGGECNYGLLGDGKCVCSEGFSSESRCLECQNGFYGPSCTPCRTCNEHGRCNDTSSGDGMCICDEGYTSESRCSLCDDGWDFNPISMSCQCAPQHFGTHCRSCPICAPHGHCNSGVDGDGRCICDIGWSDSNNCVGCMSGYYGETCVSCRKCGEGRCDDGLRGSGNCNCHHGWDSRTDCYDCEEGFFGEDCTPCPHDCGHGICSSGLNGTGQCLCHEGWKLEGKHMCITCADGYIGPTCQLCPGFLESEMACSGHGQCVMSGTEAVCECDARYGGDSCESYDFPFAMVAILGTIALSTLGFCMCTMRRLARQPHVLHGAFLDRGHSFSQSEYVEISDMADLEYFVSNDSRDWLIPFDTLSLQREVGNGTSGQVFRSLLHSGGGSSVVAVKRLYSPVTGQEYFQSFFRREVSILSRLHHPNVVRFYGVSYYNRVLYIVTDFCPKSLSGLIENPAAKGPLEKRIFMKVISQIVSGMGFLHSRNVVHRDLKPANVLISETDDVNICDFGLSRLIEPDATTMTAEVGTPSYMAPEMATMGGIQCSTKGDVYSFAILLYSTWSRSKPYGDQGMNPFQLMTAVVNGLRPVIPINCPPALARLMRSCWHQNPDVRPSFPEISLILKDQSLLSMYSEEEVHYYPRSPAHVQTVSPSSTMSPIFALSGHDRGIKESVNSFSSPHHDGNGGVGTYHETELEAKSISPRENDCLLAEEKQPR
ncbi:protein kinase [Plasmopara halstedii]|uniref:Protein kinase n=1 Tax=Plasmopara halstedii TaxID=4781 RepID=A0A0P1B5H7_PLAHL|nr:protein kinase [Plasmopara halstedii]CEG49762.1 protein kinase [Plasmopara halstedii]|eukprot:XP_024586131.1 protein kinase [Plasmopara halstedii]